MEKIQKIKFIVEKLEIDSAYEFFSKKTNPPYAVYYIDDYRNFSADGIVYFTTPIINIGLYTKKKDLSLEIKLEQLLTEEGFYFSKETEFLDEEKIYITTYTI